MSRYLVSYKAVNNNSCQILDLEKKLEAGDVSGTAFGDRKLCGTVNVNKRCIISANKLNEVGG